MSREPTDPSGTASARYESVSVGGVILTSGRGGAPESREFRSYSEKGLALGVLLSGNVNVTFAGRQNETFSADDGFLLSCREPIEMLHSVQPEAEARIIFLNIAQEAIAAQLQSDVMPTNGHSASWGLRAWTPNNLVLAVTRQIDLCPYVGSLRELYLQGKALELLSMVLGSVGTTQTTRSASIKTERLHEARAILTAEFAHPPTLDDLSKRVGISTSALTAGFRRAFGMSVTEFVQDVRLRRAYEALRAGETSIAQAAYSIGLSPAYFSTIFRRKFGVPPSAIVVR